MVFLIFIAIIIVLLISSKIQIEISNLKIDTKKIKKSENKITKYLNENYNIKIKLLILSKIPIIKFNINHNIIKKIEKNKKIKNFNINLRKINKNLPIELIKKANNHSNNHANVIVKKFSLNMEIGTDSTILTSMIVAIISTIISIILAKRKVNKTNLKYEIKPRYNSRKFIKYCIFRYI